jgi:uncharacterized membrane protein YcaP (DUF421 family)
MAEAAAIPIENPGRPIMLGIIPILTIFILEISLSYLCLKSDTIRYLISGRPSVIVRHGKLVRPEMRRLRYSVIDLLEQLRVRGYHNLADVEMAILESDGELSVLPKAKRRPVCIEDLGLTSPPDSPAYTLVVDGKIDQQAINEIGLDKKDLLTMLAEQGAERLEQVFVAILDANGHLFVQLK